jgi:hypothetical protein
MLVLSDNNDYLDENFRLDLQELKWCVICTDAWAPYLVVRGPWGPPEPWQGRVWAFPHAKWCSSAPLHSGLPFTYSSLPTNLIHTDTRSFIRHPRYILRHTFARWPKLFKVQDSLFYTTTTLVYTAPSIYRYYDTFILARPNLLKSKTPSFIQPQHLYIRQPWYLL